MYCLQADEMVVAVMVACMDGHVGVPEVLLAAGADIEATEKVGEQGGTCWAL